MGHFFKFSTRDPEHLETVMAPMVGSLNARPVKTSKFHVKVCARQSRWSESRRTESSPDSSIRIMETEDALIALFIMASNARDVDNKHSERVENRAALARAEEYLNASLTAPVSRADLAAAAGVSIRTLSRGFAKRHGIGPMGFLRTRRLDAAYRALLGADADSTTVTEVATHYGFSNLGKFAAEYRQTFGELPSVTLKG